MNLPHAAWAQHYDAAYELSYGRFYDWMTRTTCDQIEKVLPPPARVVDFGAGTGRMTIPLAQAGYQLTAVEPCREMLLQLQQKAEKSQVKVDSFLGRMDEFHKEQPFDLAICVFTVLLYILDETILQQSFRAVANCLKPGGFFLVDVPNETMFQSGRIRDGRINREMVITPQENDLYLYQENTILTDGGDSSTYSDSFFIKYWRADQVLEWLDGAGFSLYKDLSGPMKRSGCAYFLMQKK
jgi:SAM-dependent methyltransferase